MIHKTEVTDYKGSLQDLAEEIGNLRYDALANFLQFFAEKIEQDGLKDESRNRIKLAAHLKNSANHLKESSLEIEKAWKICEPFI